MTKIYFSATIYVVINRIIMTKLENFKGKFKNFLKFRIPKLVVRYDEFDIELDVLKANQEGITSKTFYKLMEPEFRLATNTDETGMKMTTLIDKKTGKPVRAYVGQLKTDKMHPNEEEYGIMLPDPNGEMEHAGRKYRVVGLIRFYINMERKMVTPRFESVKTKVNIDKDTKVFMTEERIYEYMKSSENLDYAGIGLRLHQIRIERMLQCNLGNSLIVADGNSFPFHYSLGYRLAPNKQEIGYAYPLMKDFAHRTQTPIMENAKYVFVDKQDGKYVVDYSATLEHFLDDYYRHGGKPLEDIKPNMFLTKKSLEQWIMMIRQQPMLY